MRTTYPARTSTYYDACGTEAVAIVDSSTVVVTLNDAHAPASPIAATAKIERVLSGTRKNIHDSGPSLN